MDFAATLRAWRTDEQLSLRALAERSGVHFTYLSKLEAGKLAPPEEQKIRGLALALGRDPAPLLALAEQARVPTGVVREAARRHPEVVALLQRFKDGRLSEEDLIVLERGLATSASGRRPAPQAFARESALILHLVATGLMELADAHFAPRQGPSLYPVSLQRALDRLTALCFRLGRADVPMGVPALIALSRQPLGRWPLQLDPAAVGEGDVLLDGAEPTQLCQEWAISHPDPEADVQEARLMQEVLDTARMLNAPEAYAAFRRLLIDRPVLTTGERRDVIDETDVFALGRFVQEAYVEAPPECLRDGVFRTCVRCRNLLVPQQDGSLGCAEERCRWAGPAAVGREIAAHGGVLWLRRDLRLFVAAPGRAELALAEALDRLGIALRLWPNFDAYDIQLTFPHGEVWAVDVKDWVSPYLLAKHVRPIPQAPAWDRAWFVFPHQRGRRQEYVRTFTYHASVLGGNPPTHAALERTFLQHVRRTLEGAA